MEFTTYISGDNIPEFKDRRLQELSYKSRSWTMEYQPETESIGSNKSTSITTAKFIINGYTDVVIKKFYDNNEFKTKEVISILNGTPEGIHDITIEEALAYVDNMTQVQYIPMMGTLKTYLTEYTGELQIAQKKYNSLGQIDIATGAGHGLSDTINKLKGKIEFINLLINTHSF